MKKTGNPHIKFMNFLPAFHNAEAQVGKDIAAMFGISEMEVTDEVFDSPASIMCNRPA